MFYGDPGENAFISKMFRDPYKPHFHFWFLNIIEQNKDQQSFTKIISRLPEVVRHFFIKQWHETPSEEQVASLVDLVKSHLSIEELPEPILTEGKFPPVLKIRGLLHRDGNKKKQN